MRLPTAGGRRLNIVDEYTREALAMTVGRTCDADTVFAVLDTLRPQRGAPTHLQNNGPELITWALRDWCRASGAGTI